MEFLIQLSEFQSTSPVRGTTPRQPVHCEWPTISIHVPREGDDVLIHRARPLLLISIHVPREGDDAEVTFGGNRTVDFNPRPP